MRISDWISDVCSSDLVPSNVTRSDLIDMGIEPDVVDALPSSAGETDGEGRAQARYGDESYDGGRQHIGLGGDASMDRIDLRRSEEHTSELQSLMRRSYAVFCLKTKKRSCAKYS